MINIVVACDENRGIGYQGEIPWHFSADMKFFKKLTMDNIVIMGRKTWESLPYELGESPLPGRFKIVLSSGNPHVYYDDLRVYTDWETVLEVCATNVHLRDKDIFIIGGGEIYKQALEMGIVDKIYMTHVMGKYEADTFFPSLDIYEGWEMDDIYRDEKYEDYWFRCTYKKCLS